MREKEIEDKLVKAIRAVGGEAWKFVSPGTSGVPDRIILLAGGRISFVEVKAPNQKPRALQLVRIKRLNQLGFKVYVLDSVDGIDKIIKETMKDGIHTT